MKKSYACFLIQYRFSESNDKKHKFNSRNREKVSDHIPLAFIYFVYEEEEEGGGGGEEEKEMDNAEEYIYQRCYYYRKSLFSETQID